MSSAKTTVHTRCSFPSTLGAKPISLEAKLSQMGTRRRRGEDLNDKFENKIEAQLRRDQMQSAREQAKSLVCSLQVARGLSTWSMLQHSQGESLRSFDFEDITEIPSERRKNASLYVNVHSKKIYSETEATVAQVPSSDPGSNEPLSSSSSSCSETSDDSDPEDTHENSTHTSEICTDNDVNTENDDNIPLLWRHCLDSKGSEPTALILGGSEECAEPNTTVMVTSVSRNAGIVNVDDHNKDPEVLPSAAHFHDVKKDDKDPFLILAQSRKHTTSDCDVAHIPISVIIKSE
eukprot:m.163123 g.163123  ORF g.163123 m.163123 type:complete len:291 (-) comp18097_c0_seq1:17-889(-)